jgi:hypothetical protein
MQQEVVEYLEALDGGFGRGSATRGCKNKGFV